MEGVIARLADAPLTYDDSKFLMGGLHLDYDSKEIWLWRMWDNNVDVELPDYWGGWTLHDCRHDCRAFYLAIPHVVDFVDRSDDECVGKIRKRVINRRFPDYPHGMSMEDRERIFSVVLMRYRQDNPRPRNLPGISSGGY